jgi:mevalonate pyrophosphate decarboxylase
MVDERWDSFEKLKKRVLDSGWFMSWYFTEDMRKIIQYAEELRAENKTLIARIEVLGSQH